ncbi:M20/M25/M40 family metallo-hydrolase, partial [Marimonas sp. MJW-29]
CGLFLLSVLAHGMMKMRINTMKGGLAASIIAAEAFIEKHHDFAGAIEISGTADEETGGSGGVAYLAEKGYFDPKRV